jgi:hypothetical protein
VHVTVADLVASIKNEAQVPNAPGNYAGVFLLAQDPALQRLVSTWPNVPVSAMPAGDMPCPETMPEGARLRWLWTLLEPDPLPVWRERAGLPDAPHVTRAQWLAIENKMVLPDGTLSVWTERWVRQQVLDRLGGG